MIISLCLKTIVSSKRSKNASCAITNAIMKDISKIIKEFEKFPYNGYVWKRPKHEPTDSYFYLSIHISKCTMISDALNLHVYPVRTEMTGMQRILISHVCGLNESELKGIITERNLSQVCYVDKRESENFIVNESSTEDIKLKSVHESIKINK